VPTRYNSAADGGRLQWFAPHQPRLDHHLFYEGVEIDLAETSGVNPYYAATSSILERLAHRLLEPSPPHEVLDLLAPPPGEHGGRRGAWPRTGDGQGAGAAEGRAIAAIRFRREWVRFSTPDEHARNGAWWQPLEASDPQAREATTVDLFVRRSPPTAYSTAHAAAAAAVGTAAYVDHNPPSVMRLLPLSSLALPRNGFWAVYERELRQRSQAANERERGGVLDEETAACEHSQFAWALFDDVHLMYRKGL